MVTIEKKTVNEFEKIVYLEMKNKQLAIRPNSEYFETYEKLTEEEKDAFKNISNEIHDIWTWINTKQRFENDEAEIHTIKEYNDLINPVNKIILNLASKYNITLKNKLTEKLKKAMIDLFGKDYLIRFINKIE